MCSTNSILSADQRAATGSAATAVVAASAEELKRKASDSSVVIWDSQMDVTVTYRLIGAVAFKKIGDTAATAASDGPATDDGSNASPIPASSADARSSANIARLFIHGVSKLCDP